MSGGQLRDGAVCVWSIRSVRWPAWSFRTACGVSAVAVAGKGGGGFLAVGLEDGGLQLREVGQQQEEAAYQCMSGPQKHRGPIWQMAWVEEGQRKAEALVTVAGDGRVCQWRISKGLEANTLVTVRKIGAPVESLSRLTGVFSIQFRTGGRSFLVSTEDGCVHECRTNFGEQMTRSFRGHLGAVYKVHESPFVAGLFLTASEDWTVKLWTHAKGTCLLTMQSGNEGITDVQWSPDSATLFAAGTSSGRVDLWDLQVSITQPVATFHIPGGAAVSQFLFSRSAPVLFVGSNSGVHVLRLHEAGGASATDAVDVAAQARRLEICLETNVSKIVTQ